MPSGNLIFLSTFCIDEKWKKKTIQFHEIYMEVSKLLCCVLNLNHNADSFSCVTYHSDCNSVDLMPSWVMLWFDHDPKHL